MSASNDRDTINDKALEGIGRPITRSRTRKAKEAMQHKVTSLLEDSILRALGAKIKELSKAY